MQKKLPILFISMLLMSVLLLACGSGANETARLGEKPTLTLTDALSSQMNQLVLTSGDYSWNWESSKPGEMQSVIACGIAPLEYAGMEGVSRLKLADDNSIEGAPYHVSGDVRPDTLTVRRWDSSAIGDMEAEALSVETYTSDNLLVELLPDSVYEFVAEWNKENLEAYGAYGEASFVLVTE